jgi:hypothetical protein
MKAEITTVTFYSMKTKIITVLLLAGLCAGAWAQEKAAPLDERQFQESINSLRRERNDSERLRQARQPHHRLSSRQVKEMAKLFADEQVRLEYAMAAYPQVVDPENFYEVYDAFTSFSKVMRLHDRVRQMREPAPGPGYRPEPAFVGDEEFKDILKGIRNESFDNTRMRIAKQILSTSRKPFLASQVKAMLGAFDFDAGRLELAKFAYEYTFDKERYFVVNEAFSFDSAKNDLARYIESKRKP